MSPPRPPTGSKTLLDLTTSAILAGNTASFRMLEYLTATPVTVTVNAAQTQTQTQNGSKSPLGPFRLLALEFFATYRALYSFEVALQRYQCRLVPHHLLATHHNHVYTATTSAATTAESDPRNGCNYMHAFLPEDLSRRLAKKMRKARETFRDLERLLRRLLDGQRRQREEEEKGGGGMNGAENGGFGASVARQMQQQHKKRKWLIGTVTSAIYHQQDFEGEMARMRDALAEVREELQTSAAVFGPFLVAGLTERLPMESSRSGLSGLTGVFPIESLGIL